MRPLGACLAAPSIFACFMSRLLYSYPVLYCTDRGNIEIVLAICMAASLLLYGRKQFGLNFLDLTACHLSPPPSSCLPLSCALLLLFFRRRLLHWIILGAAGFVLVNWCVSLIAPKPPETHLVPGYKFLYFTAHYVMGQGGITSSADAWNLFRLTV